MMNTEEGLCFCLLMAVCDVDKRVVVGIQSVNRWKTDQHKLGCGHETEKVSLFTSTEAGLWGVRRLGRTAQAP